MDEISVHEPLLSSQHVDHVKSKSLIVSLSKWILKTVMWLVFISWVALIFVYPAESMTNLVRNWTEISNDNVFGTTGLPSEALLLLLLLIYLFCALSTELALLT